MGCVLGRRKWWGWAEELCVCVCIDGWVAGMDSVCFCVCVCERERERERDYCICLATLCVFMFVF